MTIRVCLFANLARYLPPGARDGRAWLDLPDGVTVDEVCRHLAIPEGLPGLYLVNGQEAPSEHRLNSGDVLSIIPPLSGG